MNGKKKVVIITAVGTFLTIIIIGIFVSLIIFKSDINKEETLQLINRELDVIKTGFEDEQDEIIPVIISDAQVEVISIEKKDGRTIAKCEFTVPDVYGALQATMEKYGYEQVSYDFLIEEIITAISNASNSKKYSEVVLEKSDGKWKAVLDYNDIDAYLGGYLSFGIETLSKIDEMENAA